MARRVWLWGLAMWCGLALAGQGSSPLFQEPFPDWTALIAAWSPRSTPDAADLLVERSRTEPQGFSSDLTRQILPLLEANPEPLRQFILVEMIASHGDRDDSAQAIFTRILNGKFSYPKQALLNALLLTSTDTQFLALALETPDDLFLDRAVQARVMSDPRWLETPALFQQCALGSTTPRDIVGPTGRLDNAAIDDLESRNHCLYALGNFPTVQTVGRIRDVIARYPDRLGSDAARVLRIIITSAVGGSDLSVEDAADSVLFDTLDTSTDPILRINTVIGLSVPGNDEAVEPLERRLLHEADPDVAKFIRQALGIIQRR